MQGPLIPLIQQAKVPDKDQGFVEEFFCVIARVKVHLCVGKDEAEQVVKLLIHSKHHVLHDAHIHPHHVVEHLHTHDGKRKHGLRQDKLAGRRGR